MTSNAGRSAAGMSLASRTRGSGSPRILLVESERLGPARQRAQLLDALDHPADNGEVAVQVAGGVADDRVKLAAGPGVGVEPAPHADRGVAMGKRRPARLGAVRHRPAVGEARRRGIGIGRAQGRDPKALQAARIFGRRLGIDARGPRLFALVIAPLRDIIVLHPIDRRARPIAASRQRLDIGDVNRREARRELEDDSAARRRGRSPAARRRGSRPRRSPARRRRFRSG